ncbi:transglutaminase domain-containing protein [Parasporobacterium paucivorans]|uniref:Transglutaminase-like superfamily protein n=1 Tax=Parasporobacterium paucivorans DSM 15970 TaxID=1122934 RepID=A0A1M6EV73_9FIRM|nr:transglutaminase domain-containing protein [Parasporobacterium paucivorans]SHI89367.1 Transglutaminase-like superfamily protein [Parasporobacterium paucivorans DSM 15970]
MKKKSIFSFLVIIIAALVVLFTHTPSPIEKPMGERELYLSYITSIIEENIDDSMSDYEKAKTIHDYIIINTDYDTSDNLNDSAFSPEGVFVYGTAVCQGYAESYMLILNELGIDCKLVTGTANGIVHAWNVVKIDGEWYNVDVTWDDPIVSGEVVSGTGNLSYAYFMKPDAVLYTDHTASSSPPACTSDKYLYIEQYYGIPYVILDSVDQIPEVFSSYYESGIRSLTMYFPEDADPAENGLLSSLGQDLNRHSTQGIPVHYYPTLRYFDYSYITIFTE